MIKSVNEFYNKVCKLVVEISTMEWEKIVVKIAKDDYTTSIGVYYKINGEYTFILDLVDAEEIDEDAYEDVSDEIYDMLNELKDEFDEAEERMWTNLLLIISDKQQYEAKVDYEKLPEDSFAAEVKWRYKYLGIDPGKGFKEILSNIKQEIL